MDADQLEQVGESDQAGELLLTELGAPRVEETQQHLHLLPADVGDEEDGELVPHPVGLARAALHRLLQELLEEGADTCQHEGVRHELPV